MLLDPDILGKPNEGFHKDRIFGLAQNDVLGTLGLAFIVSVIWKLDFWNVLIGLVILAIVLHFLFRVNTALNVALFGMWERKS